MAQMYGSVAEGIERGYLYEVGGELSTDKKKGSESSYEDPDDEKDSDVNKSDNKTIIA